MNLIQRFTPKVLADCKNVYVTDGFRGVCKKYGWKVVAAFFVFYLTRDVLLYLIIPWCLVNGVF